MLASSRSLRLSFLTLLSTVLLTGAAAAQGNGPLIISGLSPDAVGHFDADQCRGCDGFSQSQALCTNECLTTCEDAGRTSFAPNGCAEFNDDQNGCQQGWQQSADGLPLSCVYAPANNLCSPCVADSERAGVCTNSCHPCADPARTEMVGGDFLPDGCRGFDGNSAGCATAYVLNGFSSAPVSCFFNASNECRACDVGARLAGECTEACAACPARDTFANAPGDEECLSLAGDETACEDTWHFTGGFVPASCFFTPGTEVNQGGFLFLQDGFDSLGPLVTNGKKLAVCLGCNGTTASEGFDAGFDESTLPGLGWTRTTINDPAAIADFLAGTGTPVLADAGIVYMPSQQTDGPHFGIGPEQVAPINANAAALAAFVAGGGGVFALNQARLPGGFRWLAAILPDLAVRFAATCIQQPEFTPPGEATFPSVSPEILESSDDFSSAYFVGTFGTLAVLATEECHDVTCKDPEHPTFAGGPGNDICQQIGDEATCNDSWYLTQSGPPATCSFVGVGTIVPRGLPPVGCIGCGRNEQGEDPCGPNTCFKCDDPTRTFNSSEESFGCESLAQDTEACATAWQAGFDLNASCFFDGDAGFCRACTAENEALGICTNTCEPPAGTRAVTIGLGGVGPEPTGTPSPTATATPEPTGTGTPEPEPTASAEPTLIPSATASATVTPTVTASEVATPVPTITLSPAPGGPLRSFQCYAVHQGPYDEIPGVQLGDEFGNGTLTLRRNRRLCAPADVGGADAGAPADVRHLLGYHVNGREPRFQGVDHVLVTNRFGTIDVNVLRPLLLLTPTLKSLAADPGPPPSDLDRFQCYQVAGAKQRASDLQVVDQFGTLTVDVKRPAWLCAPVAPNGRGFDVGGRALMCYGVRPERPPQFPGRKPVFVHDEFGPRAITMKRPTEVCVPSTIGPLGD